MATQAEKAKSFRKLHVPGEPLVLFNIWDPGSAKVVAETAAMALATSSWAVSVASGYSDGEHTPLPVVIDNLDGSPKQRIYRLQWIWRAVMEIRPRKWEKLSV